jgi:ankyrin repeat protein
MHWTPIDGTTLLHIAIDFDDEEIFDLLLAEGADVNARAKVDAEGFGGHTPIFNAVVSHGRTAVLDGPKAPGTRRVTAGARVVAEVFGLV